MRSAVRGTLSLSLIDTFSNGHVIVDDQLVHCSATSCRPIGRLRKRMEGKPRRYDNAYCIAHADVPPRPVTRSARLPNTAGFLRIHGLAFGALKCLTELLEVLDGIIHADLSH